MTMELFQKWDEDFREFWNRTGDGTLDMLKFDPDNSLHYAIVEYCDQTGEIINGLILVPFYRDGKLIVHHAHLACTDRNKRMIRFCRKVLEISEGLNGVEIIYVELQNNPEKRNIAKIVQHVGLQPVENPEFGGFDYMYRTGKKEELVWAL